MLNLVLSLVVHFFLVSLGSCGREPQIYQVSDPQSGEGSKSLESPTWSVQEKALYWVSNIGDKKLFRMDGYTGEITSRTLNYGSPSLIVPVKDNPGYVVVAIRSSLFLLKWGAPGGDKALRLLTTVDLGKPDNTINDGKADAQGRLFFGTLGKLDFKLPNLVVPDQGTLYSIDFSSIARPTIHKRPVGISNGIAFSADNKKLYYNDSPTKKVVVFDYDLDKGTIANETEVFRLDEHGVGKIVDGLTIDVDGNLWVATLSSKILKVDPSDGTLLDVIELPVNQVTSMMWGGPDLDELFVTTAAAHVDDPQPLSGSLLVLRDLGTAGVPEHQFMFPDAANY